MNDLLQQLIGMGPGIGAAAAGNGPAFASFMDGWKRAEAEHAQKKRLQQQDTLALEDRQNAMTRQQAQDARAAEDQKRQTELYNVGMARTLGQQAEGAESVPEGESAIDALYRVLSPETQSVVAPARDAALSGVQRTVTGRQKKQVEAYVEAALKTSHIADNPDADPEMRLPEHMQRILGKSSARLSELQSFAQLPVGKPAGKTRIPAAAGSMEEFSDPSITPERKAQILADRKAYMQSDDRAPRVTVNTAGDGIDRASALKFQDDYARDSKPYLTMREAYQRVKSAKPDAAGDLSLIFAYMKILDPNSVVREQEFANAQNAAGVPARIRNQYNKVMEGTRLAPEQRQQFLSQAEALFEGAKTNQRGVRKTYGDRARDWKIPETMVLDAEDEFLGAAPAPRFQVGQKVRNKKTGEVREVTGVRPDGQPILGPVKQ